MNLNTISRTTGTFLDIIVIRTMRIGALLKRPESSDFTLAGGIDGDV